MSEIIYKELDEDKVKEFKDKHPWFGKDIFVETVKHVFPKSWKRCCEELPPEDGIYEVTNSRTTEFDIGICEYNGFGFIYDSHYVNPLFWRHIQRKEKRYGVIK